MFRLSMLLLCYILKGQTPIEQRIPWTIDDQIAIERMPSYLEGVFSEPFQYSARSQLVAFTTLKPDIRTDETEARLQVFRISDLREYASAASSGIPRPVFAHIARSKANRPAIGEFKWTQDGTGLLFLVQEAPGRNALYQWHPGKKAASKVVELDTEISTYDLLGPSKSVVVYSVLPSKRDARTYAPELVNGRSLYSAISTKWTFPYQLRPQRVHVVDSNRGSMRLIPGTVSIRLGTFPSPNGRYVALTAPFKVRWNGTCWAQADSPLASDELDSIGGHELQYAVIDAEKGTVGLPMEAPTGFASGLSSYPDVVWSRDGTRALLPFSFRPADRCGQQDKRGAPALFALNLPDLQTDQIYTLKLDPTTGDGPVQSAVWSTNGDTIHLSFAKPVTAGEGGGRKSFQRTAQGWVEISSTPLAGTEAGKVRRVLEIRQALNTPPAIYALGDGESARMLHDLAPHVRNRQLGRVESFSWNDSSSRKWEGILAWPTDYNPARRYPAVLQTHGFERGAFFAEGPTTTAFPGRAAAERGFFVLTIRENGQAMFGEPAIEAGNVLDGYRSAIAELEKRGFVDRARIGVIGWSRTSFHVKHALTTEPNLFAAAVAADGVDYGYDHYLRTVDLFGNETDKTWDAVYGGPPFANWEAWRRRSVTFNVDKVTAPVRAEANSGREALLSEWEFYAGLRKLEKPVELWVYPEGEHSLLRPLERRLSQTGSLDWLDYWLNDRRDPAAEKREQYRRWDAMRTLSNIPRQ